MVKSLAVIHPAVTHRAAGGFENGRLGCSGR